MTVSGDTTIMHDGDHSSPEAVDGGEEIQGQRDTAVIDDILIQVDTGVSNDTDVEVIPLNRTAMRVFMADMAFNPGEITISAGTQITWTNNDDMPHDVVATDGSFKSPILQK